MPFEKNPQLESILKKKLMGALDRSAIVLQNEIKDNLSGKGGGLKVRTGNLRRSIQIDRTNVKDFHIEVGTKVKYARIHEFGGIIKAKFAKLLRFKIGGFWKSKKSVMIPPRPYMRPSLKSAKNKILKQFKGII